MHKLIVYQQARQNLRDIVKATAHIRQFGDIKNQIERSALSVVSNIAEGAGSNSDANFVRFLGYARASNKELHCQLEVLQDLGQLGHSKLASKVDQVSAMLYKLIQK